MGKPKEFKIVYEQTEVRLLDTHDIDVGVAYVRDEFEKQNPDKKILRVEVSDERSN